MIFKRNIFQNLEIKEKKVKFGGQKESDLDFRDQKHIQTYNIIEFHFIIFLVFLFQNIPNEWARGVFGDIEKLTNKKLHVVLREFLKDYKEGSLESKNWPPVLSGYTMSKTALNSYTRMLAKKFPRFRINCLCPGFVKTDINHYVGFLTIDEGAECPARLALLPDNGPSGLFFLREEVLSFV